MSKKAVDVSEDRLTRAFEHNDYFADIIDLYVRNSILRVALPDEERFVGNFFRVLFLSYSFENTDEYTGVEDIMSVLKQTKEALREVYGVDTISLPVGKPKSIPFLYGRKKIDPVIFLWDVAFDLPSSPYSISSRNLLKNIKNSILKDFIVRVINKQSCSNEEYIKAYFDLDSSPINTHNEIPISNVLPKDLQALTKYLQNLINHRRKSTEELVDSFRYCALIGKVEYVRQFKIQSARGCFETNEKVAYDINESIDIAEANLSDLVKLIVSDFKAQKEYGKEFYDIADRLKMIYQKIADLQRDEEDNLNILSFNFPGNNFMKEDIDEIKTWLTQISQCLDFYSLKTVIDNYPLEVLPEIFSSYITAFNNVSKDCLTVDERVSMVEQLKEARSKVLEFINQGDFDTLLDSTDLNINNELIALLEMLAESEWGILKKYTLSLSKSRKYRIERYEREIANSITKLYNVVYCDDEDVNLTLEDEPCTNQNNITFDVEDILEYLPHPEYISHSSNVDSYLQYVFDLHGYQAYMLSLSILDIAEKVYGSTPSFVEKLDGIYGLDEGLDDKEKETRINLRGCSLTKNLITKNQLEDLFNKMNATKIQGKGSHLRFKVVFPSGFFHIITISDHKCDKYFYLPYFIKSLYESSCKGVMLEEDFEHLSSGFENIGVKIISS